MPVCCVLQVRQGTDYLRCVDQTYKFPTPSAPCELGASASDEQDGDVTARVLLCPPEGCLAQDGCAQHRQVAGPCFDGVSVYHWQQVLIV